MRAAPSFSGRPSRGCVDRMPSPLRRSYVESRCCSGPEHKTYIGFATASQVASSDRRLDALVIPSGGDRVSPQGHHLSEIGTAVESHPVDLIEAKARLDIDVIGQLLCGAAMFTAKYPNHGPMRLIALVGKVDDAALMWFCNLERIEVVALGEVWRNAA